MARRESDQAIDGDRIRERRQAMGLTLADAAYLSGVSERTWSRYERGEGKTGLRAIAERIDQFLTRRENRQARN